MSADLRILDALRRRDVPFVIVGGHAVNFHGYARVTEDTDVVWLRSPETEQSLLLALMDMNAQYITSEIDPSTRIERAVPVSLPFIRSSHLMMLWTDHGFLDLFDYVPGIPDQEVKTLFDTSVEADGLRYASLAWLRQMKRAAARTKDTLDLENLPE